MFFTGSAGTGKSYLLKRLITMLPPQSTFITASTGEAACHIGGTTIASNRRRLLSDKARSFENISPPTDKDFTVGCKKRPLEDKNGVTPKRIKTTGRKSDSNCGNDEHSGPERRRLRSLSSFQMNLIPEKI